MNMTNRSNLISVFAMLSAFIGLGLGAPAHATTDNSNMTIGVVLTGLGSDAGFFAGAFGSMSPTTLSGGRSYVQWYENFPIGSTFELSGFTSDPGKSWLTSATCTGTSKAGASATYAYGSGIARWQWSGLFGFANWLSAGKGPAPCTVAHS